MLIQATAVQGPALPVDPHRRITPKCVQTADSDEVVICGKVEEPYRLKHVSDDYEAPLIPKAETSVLGGTLTAEGEQGSVGGVASPRAMARFKLKF